MSKHFLSKIPIVTLENFPKNQVTLLSGLRARLEKEKIDIMQNSKGDIKIKFSADLVGFSFLDMVHLINTEK